MPLHGKIVVVKRSGGDGTEFPLTASCLFGRKPDCDIRIQLPQVSKEHCRIDLNENKEVILTNLSSVNPTCVNGEALLQSERLKHGDVITIIDRSFRFEYPPAPTPKKSSKGGKTETLKVLQDQHFGDAAAAAVGTGEKRIFEESTDPHLKDGTNQKNIQRSLDKTVAVESKEDGNLQQGQTSSPFSDLYQMIKKSLDVKTPRKSGCTFQTPSSRFCVSKPRPLMENDETVTSAQGNGMPNTAEVHPGASESLAEVKGDVTPKSSKKQKRTSEGPTLDLAETMFKEAENAAKPEATSPQTRRRSTPQKFNVCEAVEQVLSHTSKSPMRRRSKEATSAKADVTKVEEKKISKKRKSGELATELPTPQMKKKRVSFGGYLSPELFDKKLPPDSPLRKGAMPRRSLCLPKPKQSLLRRASVAGLPMESDHLDALVQSPAKQSNASPKGLVSGKKSPKSRTASLKAPSPGKKSPKSKTPKPKALSPGSKTPKPRTPSPKAPSPGKKSPKPKAPSPGTKSPKPRTPSPKAPSPGKKPPKSKTPSPKAPSPGTKSPKPRTPSPKAPSPGKKPPKSKTPSPKAPSPGTKSPKLRTPSPTAQSPEKKSPNSKTSSRNEIVTLTVKDQPESLPKSSTPGQLVNKETLTGKRRASLAVSSPTPENAASVGVMSVRTPVSSQVPTPTVRGRFSVSRINTPSPVAENDVAEPTAVVTVTPKIPLKRKSMKSKTQKTPHVTKSAVKVLQRRSGLSRASIKAKNCWADIVKFGQTKVQVAAPFKKMTRKKTVKKMMSKPQTPARNPMGHMSTGHADSPVTIIVGRALQRRVVHPTAAAAPKVVLNTAVLKKSMKMDEDLTGISEIFKTPVTEKKRRSGINERAATQTPVGVSDPSLVEPSVLNTPEEPGEMMVSPLSVASGVKARGYNSEAVKRLLHGDEESSFDGDNFPVEMHADDSGEQQCTEMQTTPVSTPKQKPGVQECLTGVKRIMKTPKQKAEPVEDLRGKLLKTPKQKLEAKECLTGVKRIMKTPKQKAEPVEDLRGRLLKTPKQKTELQECLTGVKRIMKTPKEKTEPVEDIKETLLTTPKQKPEPQVCLTGVKRIFQTPKQEDDPREDLQGKHLETPRDVEVPNVNCSGLVEPLETPADVQESPDLPVETDMTAPNLETLPLASQENIKVIMNTPNRESAPVGDALGDERLMKTPDEKDEPVGNVGLSELVNSPQPKDDAPAEETQELLEEPFTGPSGQTETHEAETQPECGFESLKELDFTQGELESNVPRPPGEDVIHKVPEVNMAQDADELVADQIEGGAETDTTAPAGDKLPIQHGSVPTEESKATDAKKEAAEPSEDPVVATPVRERRGKRSTAPPAARQTTRGRNAKSTESMDGESTQEKNASVASQVDLKPRRGRPAKNVSTQAETLPESESEQTPQGAADDSAAPLENLRNDLKPKRGRRPKQEPVQSTPEAEQQEPEQQELELSSPMVEQQEPEQSTPEAEQEVLVGPHGEDTLQGSMTQEMDAVKVNSDQLKAVMAEVDETKSSDATHVVTESLPEVEPTNRTTETELDEPIIEKKAVRGRRAKPEEPRAAEQEAAVEQQPCEDLVISAPVRERRARKTAPPAVRQTTRGRNAKSQQDAGDGQPEMVPGKAVGTQLGSEISLEAANDPTQMNASQENEAPLPAQEAVLKPSRGRKTKHTPVEMPEPEKQTERDRRLNADDDELQKPVPIVEKPRRGRKKNPDNIEQNEVIEDSVMSVGTMQQSQPLLRSKRGRNARQEEENSENNSKTSSDGSEPQEPVKKWRRTRKVEQEPEEPQVEIVSVETEVPLVSESVKTIDQPAVAAKTKRGRKAKQDTEVVSTETLEDPTDVPVEKPKRGRRANIVDEVVIPKEPEEKPEAPQNEILFPEGTEAPLVSEAALMNDQPAVVNKARRGRKAKQETVTSVASTESQEVSSDAPVEKPKRGRKVKQVEEVITAEVPEELQHNEILVPYEAVPPLVSEPVLVNDQPSVAAKTKRGRKAKQDTETATNVESIEAEQVPTVEKPKRGRRVKQVEKVVLAPEVPEEKPEEPQEDEPVKTSDRPAAAAKTKRGQKAKLNTEMVTSVKSTETQGDTPTEKPKRARIVKQVGEIGSTAKAQEEKPEGEQRTQRTRAVKNEVSESTSTSVKAAKRGRLAAAKPTTDGSQEEVSEAVVEDIKLLKRSVKWKSDVEVREIPKPTPVKAVRGRKCRLVQIDPESNEMKGEQAEEKDLSDAESQPAKRARRGAKVADKAETTNKANPKKCVAAEMQPKTRRGRSAKN